MKVSEVQSKKDLKEFVNFPKKLYKGCPYFVPPLDSGEIKTLTKHPALEFCTLKLWLARENGKVVGRIAGIVNHKCNELKSQHRVRFGWFDVIEDESVAKALLDTVAEWGKNQGADEICGPSRFSNMEKQSMLVEGFETTPPIGSDYNYAYYPKLMETLGFEKEVDYVQFRMKIEPVPEAIHQLVGKVKDRTHVRSRKIKSKKELKQLASQFFGVINSGYKDIFNFIPLTDDEINWTAGQNFAVVDPSLVSVLEDEAGKVVGIAFCLPSLSHAFQKANGKLFPLGWFHVLHALKCEKTVDLYLTGVLPEYFNSGIHTIYHQELNEQFLKRGFEYAYSSQQLENNMANRVWSKYNSELVFRRRCYKKCIL